jgi:hypothetical protein
VNSLFIALFSFVGPVSIVVALVVMASLSRRLGEVTRRPPLYRWFLVGAALVGLSIVLRLSRIDSSGRLGEQAALLYDVPLVVGLLVSVVVAWRYWGWLLYEQDADF